MYERDDEKGVDLKPVQPDERLGGGYTEGPRSRLGGMPEGGQPERQIRRTRQKNFLLSLLGQDPATRKLMGGALAIVILLLLSVGVWSLFGEKRHQGVPVISPPAIALKDRPSNPGGMQVMSDDSLQGDVTGKGEVHLAPPAEQPDARVLAHKDGSLEASSAQHPLQSDIPSSGTMTSKATTPTLPPATEPTKGLQSDMISKEGEQQKIAMSSKETPDEAMTKHDEHHEVKSEGTPKALQAPKPLAASGNYRVQLAALDSKEKAEQTWFRLQKKYPSLFKGRKAFYSQTSRKGRTFVRLRTGGFADLKAAKAFCSQLQAHAISCTPAFF